MKIKKGSVIREYKYGTYIESTVITEPIKNSKDQLKFKSRTHNGKIIDYQKHESGIAVVR